ncbi:phytanoyl-CoA dioxygenase family protein [Paenibacillus psychroresistens]|uniref:Phytanoyl-CoA dioxygenase family protein n=1 Tax=Paenibacillus psychroresistens TaxID=1778678 RepID=A0A6B8RGF3_9BACL|nr:phytanoyl-CoA dioxygenase family protein [Paenibacillus psychroresistens]QGQ94446.1 phytanoyl-CoA dioxygenase family protein [Paenibacillus psychroresistens]
MSNEFINHLPKLSDSYVLTEEQINDFQKNGHIFLKQVSNQEEIEVFRPIVGDMVRNLNQESRQMHERDTYGKAFIQISNIWENSLAIQHFVFAKRFAKLAADLLGVDGVRIYHDQALFKEPGGGHTPWHQDQIYWPLDTDKTITMWMPIVNIPQEVGSMTFASESQKLGYLSKLAISDESHKTLKEYIENKGIATINYGAMNAGDATFHSGWTLHSAPGNPTDYMREVMTIIYYADGTKVMEPDTNARNSDLARWLPGLNAGDLAASRLNPLLFKK